MVRVAASSGTLVGTGLTTGTVALSFFLSVWPVSRVGAVTLGLALTVFAIICVAGAWKAHYRPDQAGGAIGSVPASAIGIDVQEATLVAGTPDDTDGLTWSVWLTMYVTPLVREVIDIPFHRVSVRLQVNGNVNSLLRLREGVRLVPKGQPENGHLARISSTTSELTLRGPGRVVLYATTPILNNSQHADLGALQRIDVDISPLHTSIPSKLTIDLLRALDDAGFACGRWVFPESRVQEDGSPPIVMSSREPSRSPFAHLPRPDGW